MINTSVHVNTCIISLGTNNWQRQGEFAPGSGILHEAHHENFNRQPGVACYSIFPSKHQESESADYEVFKLDHDIPICESVSPASSYRWHAMSDGEFTQYKQKLEQFTYDFMEKIESTTGRTFTHALVHHSFLNPLVMRDVINRRVAEGKNRIPIVCFSHGTALKMFVHEMKGANQEEYPMRFYKLIKDEKVFSDMETGVKMVFVISDDQKEKFLECFSNYPVDRIIVCMNGVNLKTFDPKTRLLGARELNLSNLLTSLPAPVPLPNPAQVERVKTNCKKTVVFVGKFADWKRLDSVLYAAASYEKKITDVATIIVGTGPDEDVEKYRKIAFEDSCLERLLFVGPHSQDVLAHFFSVADVGVFPSYNEPFGMVFIECMACGTPVIGTNSGGPKNFVTSEVGELVPEPGMSQNGIMEVAESVSKCIQRALKEDWKTKKGPAALKLAADKFSTDHQVSQIVDCLNSKL